ncbi:hypothetical protein PCASD_20560 [Puccinia coronata f. sp. avenae]|uniref:Uncharacterized protein n=1 Tax=Puccinia coronata f. sp. avenae TaxID=200324 RepID=A0A2N5U834_9BASI|nr:hypothetical protein PCASD_20560 [Puccinia coronata f. sp. avenae]
MFSEIEQLVDGNSKQIVDHMDDSLRAILPSVTQHVGKPLTSKVFQVQDSLQEHQKSIDFSLTNLSSMNNTTGVAIQAMNRKLGEILGVVTSIPAGVCKPEVGSDEGPQLAKLGQELSTAVRNTHDLVIAALVSRPECESAKCVQAVQALDAKVHSLQQAVELKAKAAENGGPVACAIEATMAKVTARLDAVIAVKEDECLASASLKQAVSEAVEAVMSPYLKRVDSALAKSSASERGDDAACSVNQEELEQRIEEASEGQRRDFLKLNERFDTLMSESRAEGARLRAEIAGLQRALNEARVGGAGSTTAGPAPEGKEEGGLEQISAEEQKQLTNAIAKSDWPTFSGRGEYDHMDFIHWIDSAQRHSRVSDGVIVLKLLTILTDGARSWFKTMEAVHKNRKWSFWRAEMCKKYGTSSWKRKKEDAFDADKFVAGVTVPSDWVTRQFDRLQCFSSGLSPDTINYKLMKLMDSEVEFAAKTAMRSLSADMSEVINVLEDISDKTRLGRRRFGQRPAEAGKAASPAPALATKPLPSQLECFLRKEKGHTSRRCPKTINAVEKDEPLVEEECDYDPEGPVIGGDYSGTFVVSLSAVGKNNPVRMHCCDLDCLVLLGSGAVRSVVGKQYLARFCPGWEKFILPVKPGKFHSASGALLPLGVVNIKLYLGDVKLVIQFVVMDNVRARYFILGNDCLARFKISLLNGDRRQFTIGKQMFDLDKSINAVVSVKGTFTKQVLSKAKISPNLVDHHKHALVGVLNNFREAFATAEEPDNNSNTSSDVRMF